MKFDTAVDIRKKGPFRLYHSKWKSYIEAGSEFKPKYLLNEYIIPNNLVDIVELMFKKHMHPFKAIFWLRNIVQLMQNEESFWCLYPKKGTKVAVTVFLGPKQSKGEMAQII